MTISRLELLGMGLLHLILTDSYTAQWVSINNLVWTFALSRNLVAFNIWDSTYFGYSAVNSFLFAGGATHEKYTSRMVKRVLHMA